MVLLAAGVENGGATWDFLREMLTALPVRRTRRLEALFLVHPTLKTRLAFAFLGVVLWGRLTFIDRLEQLRKTFPRGALLLPQAVLQYDYVRDVRRGIHRPPPPGVAPAAAPLAHEAVLEPVDGQGRPLP